MISMLSLMNNMFSCSSNIQLAFNIYSPNQTVNKDNDIRSQKIIIQGLDNSQLRQYIIKLLNIHKYKKKTIPTKILKIWLCQLKLTGFFKSVNIKYETKASCQVICLSLVTHPMVRRIKVINSSNKLIPVNYIKSLISPQLGLPVNTVNLKESIEGIKSWYLNRGYFNIDINIEYNLSESTLSIDIDECLMNNIHVIIVPYSQNISKLQKVILDDWLGKILSINLHEPINLYYLDKKLGELQNKKFIQQGYYKIHNRDVRELLIYIQPTSKRPTYLFGKKNIITRHFLELIEILYNYTLPSFVFYKDFSSYITSKIHKYYCKSIAYNKLSNCTYLNMSQHDFMLFPLLIRDLSPMITNPSTKWYIYNSLLTLNDNLGLKHFVRYFDRCNSNILINITALNLGPLIDIKYNLPFLQIIKYWTSSMTIHFSNSINLYKKYYKDIFNNYNDNVLVYPRYSLIHRRNLLFNVQHTIYDYTHIDNNLFIKKLTHKSLLFHNYVRWQKLKYITCEDFLFPSFIQRTLENSSIFIKHILGLNINLGKRNKLLSGTDQYCIEIISWIPTYNGRYSSFANVHKLTYSLRKKILIRYHDINILLKYIRWLGNSQYLPVPEQSMFISPDIIRGYTKEQYVVPYQLNSFRLEYYMPNVDKNIIYLFVDYLTNRYTFSPSDRNCLIHLALGDSSTNPLLKISYGFGLQIMTPIKQIPPLKLEYAYNISNGQCLHLRVENVN
uniref:POTRA domain-containing protein n=1 Tax=Izziella formosana TaxID=1653389 RepID=A0A1G4NUI2_9FLOR|nr:Hypothetical protein ORF_4 [Izziella formosana]SCW22351.1 Hypothetical protein ORF_4 [Izziella formosana]